MSRDQKIRAVLYYLSVAVFFTGLPFILTFTLGYKFDTAAWKFTRTGLISLRTQPAGAAVFLNGVARNERTPCSLNELLPGKYTVELRLPGHYPYTAQVDVYPSSVARLEKILLFPLRPDVQKLNKEQVSWFWVDEDRAVYYVGAEDGTLYRSDREGERFEKIADFCTLRTPAKQWKLSPDRRRLLYFNEAQVGVVELEPEPHRRSSFVLEITNGAVSDVFWYEDSFNAVVIAGNAICMLETRPGSVPFVLMTLNGPPRKIFYEPDTQSLYFIDTETGADDRAYENVYKLELGRRLYPFSDLIKINKKNE